MRTGDPMGGHRTRLAHADPDAESDIPAPAVARLATYLHVLHRLSERGVLVASSSQLATAAGVNSSILRKDLSHVGANGVRGVGYEVGKLTARISRALRTDSTLTVALAGAGALGHALLAHTGVGRGFRVAALFDDDPDVVGTRPRADATVVEPLAEITRICGDIGHPIDIGVIATDDDSAQNACEAFLSAGIRQILNVTPVTLSVESDVVIRQVDLALELQVLAFAAARGTRVPAHNRDVSGAASSAEHATASGKPAMGEETVTA